MSNTKHDLCAAFPRVVPITGEAELRLVLQAAAEDGHGDMRLPTHVVLKRGEILGCLTLGSIPLAHCWLHTSKLKPLETALVFVQAENELRRAGFKAVVVPVPANAPLHGHMAKHLGYHKLHELTLFGKELS